ncbi:hypothetical protein [Reyranella sp.]|uniref:hypothetical protein n=1 Tax=Reyranella sp. TaxID=1929291 RepID=UPI004035AC03
MEITPVNPKSMEAPAVFVNHFQMTVLGGGVVRLSFAEVAPPHEPVFRSTVLLGVEDARMIAQAILTALGTTTGAPS